MFGKRKVEKLEERMKMLEEQFETCRHNVRMVIQRAKDLKSRLDDRERFLPRVQYEDFIEFVLTKKYREIEDKKEETHESS